MWRQILTLIFCVLVSYVVFVEDVGKNKNHRGNARACARRAVILSAFTLAGTRRNNKKTPLSQAIGAIGECAGVEQSLGVALADAKGSGSATNAL